MQTNGRPQGGQAQEGRGKADDYCLAWWIPTALRQGVPQVPRWRPKVNPQDVHTLEVHEHPAVVALLTREVAAALYYGDDAREEGDGVEPLECPNPIIPWLGDRVAVVRDEPDWEIARILCQGDADLVIYAVPKLVDALLEAPPDEDEDEGDEGEEEDQQEAEPQEDPQESAEKAPITGGKGQGDDGEAEGEAEESEGSGASGSESNEDSEDGQEGEDEGTGSEDSEDVSDEEGAGDDLITETEGGGEDDQETEAVRGSLAEVVRGLAERKEAISKIPGLERSRRADRMLIAERILRDEGFRRVLELAGRVSAGAWTPKLVPSDAARDEIVDLERGSDLSRVIATELTKFAHPALKILFLRDYLERALLQHQMTGKEPLTRGPIVALLDESGSTDWPSSVPGLKRLDVIAAIAIGCLRIGMVQNRQVWMAGFNTSVRWTWTFVPGTTRSEDVVQHVLFLCSRDAESGTNFGPPMSYGLACVERGLRADLVLITDGEAHFEDGAIDRLDRCRKTLGVRLFTLLVGGTALNDVYAVSDEVITIESESSGVAFGDKVAEKAT